MGLRFAETVTARRQYHHAVAVAQWIGDCLATGEVVKVIEQSSDGTLNWSGDVSAVLYIDRRNRVSNIWSQPIDAGAPKQLTNFNSDLIFTFDVSKDGKSLALTRALCINLETV